MRVGGWKELRSHPHHEDFPYPMSQILTPEQGCRYGTHEPQIRACIPRLVLKVYRSALFEIRTWILLPGAHNIRFIQRSEPGRQRAKRATLARVQRIQLRA